MTPSKSTLPQESDPTHPAHRSWLAGIVNGLLDTGVLILSGGRVEVGDEAAKPDPPIGDACETRFIRHNRA